MFTLIKYAIVFGTSLVATQLCHQSHIGVQSHHRCITKNESYISHQSSNRHNCVSYCSQRQNCQVVNFNVMEGKCLISEEPCLKLEPDDQYHTTYFKLEPCIKWVPYGQERLDHMLSVYPCHVPTVHAQLYCYIVRSIKPPNALPGYVYYHDINEMKYAVLDGIIQRDVDGPWEVLELFPGCTIQWVHYTAGNDLPKGGVVGGHMASGSGSDLYVVRVTTNWNRHNITVPGYYDPASQKAYSMFATALEFTEMEILVLK